MVGGGLGAFYYGYDKAIGDPLRVGVIGTGDEGSVLLGAINPEFIEVKAIADIRPYNIWRAFHGDHYSEASLAVRPGLMAKYDWKTEERSPAARQGLREQNGRYEELIEKRETRRRRGGHHRPALAPARPGGHRRHECRPARADRKAHGPQRPRVQGHGPRRRMDRPDPGRRPPAPLQHSLRQRRRCDPAAAPWAICITSAPSGTAATCPAHDSWQQPLPPKVKPGDKLAEALLKNTKTLSRKTWTLPRARRSTFAAQRLEQVDAQLADEIVEAENFGYKKEQIKDAAGKVIYDRPAIEELIRWRLWDRTGAGLMAELGSHQLDAAGIFISRRAQGGR